MMIELVQSASNTATSGLTATVYLPRPTAQGNLLLATAALYTEVGAPPPPPSITDSVNDWRTLSYANNITDGTTPIPNFGAVSLFMVQTASPVSYINCAASPEVGSILVVLCAYEFAVDGGYLQLNSTSWSNGLTTGALRVSGTGHPASESELVFGAAFTLNGYIGTPCTPALSLHGGYNVPKLNKASYADAWYPQARTTSHQVVNVGWSGGIVQVGAQPVGAVGATFKLRTT